MILKNSRYRELAQKIKRTDSKVIIYGAGMIGQIFMPGFIKRYGLEAYIECFVDKDIHKQEQIICVGSWKYQVKEPDILRKRTKRRIILITNSKFHAIIKYLEYIHELKDTEVYIIPVMQLFELQYSGVPLIKKYSDVQMIPKKIHYCWFGKEKIPEFLSNCIETWKKMCPDYEIIEWNEDNYDVEKIPFVKEAYHHGKYSFAADVARLDILYNHGGVYMDTDVSLIKRLDELLYQPAFVGVEKWCNINTGGCVGAVSGHPMIKEMLEFRKSFSFIRQDGSMNIETNGVYETIPFMKHGMTVDNTLQIINQMTVYPSCVFHPYDYLSCEDKIEKCTISKHYFYGGWMDKPDLEGRRSTQEKYREILERIEFGGK